MVLVKASKDSEAGVMPSTELLTAMGKFNEELARLGMMLAGEGLHPTSKGARIKFSRGKPTVQQGPFNESNLVAGWWLIEANSKDAVIETFKRCPPLHDSGDGELEIRQVFEMSDFSSDVLPTEEREREAKLREQLEHKSAKR
jgi:hypothetical protein